MRIYSAHPPQTLNVIAADDRLRWKSCSECDEQSSQRLEIKAEAAAMVENIVSAGEKAAEREFYISGTYRLEPETGAIFAAHYPLYIAQRPGGLMVIASMPLEDYVAHVLMAESGDFGNREALKAMAVAVRSYAQRFRGQHAAEGFDFCDTTHCQVLYEEDVSERLQSIIESTKGETLSYKGRVASTYYHQDCGGTIAGASEAWPHVSEPYLVSHPDPYCMTKGGLKWESSLTHDQINQALAASGLQPPGHWQEIEVGERSASGRAHLLNLSGGSPAAYPLSASTFRYAVDRAFGWNKIRSNWFEIHSVGGKFAFSGRGSGHGVGLCQAGAEGMAREGKNYHEILAFYYPGTEFAGTVQTGWQKRSDEHFDLVSENSDADAAILPVAERILREDEYNIGWQLSSRVKLQVFQSLDSYRDTTGQPGWVAASTRGQTIRLQPLAELRKRSILESTLRHELYHLLVEEHISQNSPIWLREGLVLYFSNPAPPDTLAVAMPVSEIERILQKGDSRESTQKAYASARAVVANLIQHYGKQGVLRWLSDGLPPEVIRSISASTSAPQN